MDITWLGHSCLRIRSGAVTIITDPYADSVGFALKTQRADIVTVSHDHPHHAHVAAVDGDPRVLSGPGEYEVSSFYITGSGTRRGPTADADERLINTVFTFRAEGLSVCHLGDLAEPLSPRLADNLSQVDVLVVPAGGNCTLSPERVAELINLISPRLIVPVHYGIDGLDVDLEPLDGLYREMGVSNIVSQPRLNVTPASLPRDAQVVELQRAS